MQIWRGMALIVMPMLEDIRATAGWILVKPRREQAVIQKRGAAAM